MKLVIDRSISFIEGVFEPYADSVIYKEGSEICRDDLLDADGLIIRSRTRCDASLLEGTKVKIIATSSIGTDHIDLEYCHAHSILTRKAEGSNAGGVMNYVFSALYGTAARKSIPLDGLVFGIVGAGNVGSRVEHTARSLGFKVLLYDPPRAEAEGPAQFCSLDYLLQNSDIVSLHVPLNASTRGLADAYFFSKMKYGAFFINTSRGEVVIEDDLINAIPKLGPVIIDTWTGEPNINHTLLNLVDIGTPHISGYTYQSKLTGTSMTVRAVARFFGISELYEYFPKAENSLEAVKLDLADGSQGRIASAIQYNYPIFTDDFMFRMNPSGFEELRAAYQYRKEFYTE